MGPPCLWNLLTGTYCPGCGTWRALIALSCGDFAAAFMYNPFLFLLVIPFFTYMGAVYIRRAVTKKWTPSIFSSTKAIWPAVAVITVVWIFRNIFPLGLAE
ncbi:MAG: DUF2752 domain-containing protein [Chitinispirillia bacterium]|nr:DUF2752 domain-containing protein [Chitinispirillia bacterium]MCL2241386.1 DUF2752 domain-containing protein [Chitinispirillia bacterium]